MTPERPPRLASWESRVGAALLDGAIVWLIAIVAIAVAAVPSTIVGTGGTQLWLLVAFLSAWAYYAATMVREGEHNGQTLGKQAVGIRVVRNDGEPVTLGTVALREALLKLAGGSVTLGIGALVDSLWPLGDRENRAVHDHAAKTHVVEVARVPTPARIQPPPWGPPRPLLAPALARHLYAAQTIQAHIGETVRRTRLPYAGVCREVDALVGLMYHSVHRAQLLHEALASTPPARVEHRLAELEGTGKRDLIDALREQLVVQRRMEAQLERYVDELERVVVELDTVRGNLLTVSASTDVANQERLADEVRALRDEMSSVAEGVIEAYG